MTVTLNLTLPNPVEMLIYLLIGVLAALVAAALGRIRSGLSFALVSLFAALGAWFFAGFLKIQVLNDVAIYGVPLIESFIGALLFATIVVLIAARPRNKVVLED